MSGPSDGSPVERAALAGEATVADREKCTGITARWCPNCGTCTCPEDPRGGRTRDRATCPLHGAESRHGEALCAGGCGEMVTEDGERCDACELRHLRAITERQGAALRAVALWLGGPNHNPQPDAVEELARAKGRELDGLRAAREALAAVARGDAPFCEDCSGIRLATQWDDHGNPLCDEHAAAEAIVERRDTDGAAAIRAALAEVPSC